MSIESAKAFYNRMSTDEAFSNQYQNASSDEERQEIIVSSGYNFTPEEWEATLAEISNSSGEELSDAELMEVSGGISIYPGFPIKPPTWPPTYPIAPQPLYGGPTIFE